MTPLKVNLSITKNPNPGMVPLKIETRNLMIDNKFELSSPLNTHLKESDIKRQPKVLTGKVPRPQQQLSRLLDGASAVPS
jgi:hypothetical protein